MGWTKYFEDIIDAKTDSEYFNRERKTAPM